MTTHETQMSNLEENCVDGRHSVRFLVRHPEMELSFLSESTGFAPQLNWLRGNERKSPTGKLLPGTHRSSTWSFSVQLREPSFSSIVEMMLVGVEKAAAEIVQINKSGGSASLILDLDGRSNIGDSLSPALLARIGALGLELGIEVFPNKESG